MPLRYVNVVGARQSVVGLPHSVIDARRRGQRSLVGQFVAPDNRRPRLHVDAIHARDALDLRAALILRVDFTGGNGLGDELHRVTGRDAGCGILGIGDRRDPIAAVGRVFGIGQQHGVARRIADGIERPCPHRGLAHGFDPRISRIAVFVSQTVSTLHGEIGRPVPRGAVRGNHLERCELSLVDRASRAIGTRRQTQLVAVEAEPIAAEIAYLVRRTVLNQGLLTPTDGRQS